MAKRKLQRSQKNAQELRSNGFKMIVSQDPVISKKDNKQYIEANKLGYFVKKISELIKLTKCLGLGVEIIGVVDFTIPEVTDWWGKYQQKPLDDGVSGFGRIWENRHGATRRCGTLNMKHKIGMHDEIHNVFGLTWDKVVKNNSKNEIQTNGSSR